MTETITKAGLARHLGISKAAVSYYVKRGLPTLDDGQLDRLAALTWLENNIDPNAGGAPMKRVLVAGNGNGTREQGQAAILAVRAVAVKEILNFLRRPARLEWMARDLIRLGFSLRDTWAAVRLYDAHVVFAGSAEDDWVQPGEVDWEALAREVGQKADVKVWTRWWNAAVDGEPAAKRKRKAKRGRTGAKTGAALAAVN